MDLVKILEHARLLTGVGISQAIVQGVGFLSGMVIVWTLPPQEFGFYVLANTALGVISTVVDSGIVTAAVAEGGQCWNDRNRLGTVLQTAFSIRNRAALICAGVIAPAIVAALIYQGASVPYAVIICLAALLQGWVGSLGLFWGVPLSLHQRLKASQSIQILQNLARLLLVSIVVPICKISLVPFLVGASVSTWAVYRIKSSSIEVLAWPSSQDAETRGKLRNSMLRLMPAAISQSVTTQITIWLISILGSSEAVAEIGALGRLGQAGAIASAVTWAAIVPRFARIPSSEVRRVSRTYTQVLGGLALCGLGVIGFVVLFPGPCIWLLGRSYQHLEYALVHQATASVMMFLCNAAYQLGSSRNVITHPVLTIGFEVVAYVIGITVLEVSTIPGVLKLQAGLFGTLTCLHVANYALRKHA